MDLIVNKFKSMYRMSVVFSIVLFLLGVFLLVQPETTLNVVSYTIGTFLIVWGIIPVLTFLSNKDNNKYLEVSFIIGVFALIIGIVIMLNPKLIVSIIPFVIGVWMVINGITKLSYSLSLNKENDARNSIILSILILVCGIILVFNPFSGAVVLTQVIGISVIMYALIDLADCFTLRKIIKKTKTKNNDSEGKVIEAVYEEK